MEIERLKKAISESDEFSEAVEFLTASEPIEEPTDPEEITRLLDMGAAKLPREWRD